jgi:hypothetical protein
MNEVMAAVAQDVRVLVAIVRHVCEADARALERESSAPAQVLCTAPIVRSGAVQVSGLPFNEDHACPRA